MKEVKQKFIHVAYIYIKLKGKGTNARTEIHSYLDKRAGNHKAVGRMNCKGIGRNFGK
jgi:hypothetical protein